MMNRIPTSPPRIIPVLPNRKRPIWSVMIPVYNCANYLREALASVLIQDMGSDFMQIEVVDDASTDEDIASLVSELGKGRITYFRQPHNVGSLRNFETCLNRSTGYFVHLLHGDDKVYDGYYREIISLFEQYPQAGAAFCRHNHIDENSNRLETTLLESTHSCILNEWLLKLSTQQRMQYCSVTVKREVYEVLGGFYGVTYGEDWEMWMRIAHKYPIAYTPNILAAYRRHINSISGQSIETGQNLLDLQWVIEALQEYLPLNERARIKQESLKNWAHGSLALANFVWRKSRKKEVAQAQINGAVQMHQDILLYLKVIFLYSRMILNF